MGFTEKCLILTPELLRSKMRELRGDALRPRLQQLRAVRHAPEEEQLSRAALRGPHGRQGGGDSQEGAEDVSEGRREVGSEGGRGVWPRRVYVSSRAASHFLSHLCLPHYVVCFVDNESPWGSPKREGSFPAFFFFFLT